MGMTYRDAIRAMQFQPLDLGTQPGIGVKDGDYRGYSRTGCRFGYREGRVGSSVGASWLGVVFEGQATEGGEQGGHLWGGFLGSMGMVRSVDGM